MVNKDYLIRMTQEATHGLSCLINPNKCTKESQAELEYFYTNYLNKDRQYFLDIQLEDLVTYLQNFNETELAYRLSLLAEVIYHDTLLTDEPNLKKELALKAAFLYEQLNLVDQIKSVDRQNRIAQLNRWGREQQTELYK